MFHPPSLQTHNATKRKETMENGLDRDLSRNGFLTDDGALGGKAELHRLFVLSENSDILLNEIQNITMWLGNDGDVSNKMNRLRLQLVSQQWINHAKGREPTGDGNGGSVGDVDLEFRIAVPASPISFHFSSAMESGARLHSSLWFARFWSLCWKIVVRYIHSDPYAGEDITCRLWFVDDGWWSEVPCCVDWRMKRIELKWWLTVLWVCYSCWRNWREEEAGWREVNWFYRVMRG